MFLEDFNYLLPDGLIANEPASPRDSSRLLVYESKDDRISDKSFFDLGSYLKAGDVLVLNASRVIPARILFEVAGKELEIFLLKSFSMNERLALVRPGKKFKIGVEFDLGRLMAKVEEIFDDGSRRISFKSKCEGEDVGVGEVLNEIGQVPLPPYIENNDEDIFEKYQTVYAKYNGSVAAPTAGLHFTEGLIESLKARGIVFAEVILHVGRGTFLPVKTEKIQDHKMHEEFIDIDDENLEVLNRAVSDGRRIIAVGTTGVRVLESKFDIESGSFRSGAESTDIYIYPGSYKWKVVDGLITNFHLPKSTLLMLVSSFLESKGEKKSVKKLMGIYEHAIKEKYRFYSFGDASLFL